MLFAITVMPIAMKPEVGRSSIGKIAETTLHG